MPIKSTTIKLDEELHTRVRELAEGKRRTSHWLMQEAITQYVNREEARARLYEDARRSWEHYQETGRYVKGDVALAWLDSWGTAEEKPTPEWRSER